MIVVFAPAARLPGGWARNVRLEIDHAYRFIRLTPGGSPAGAYRLPGPIVPSMPNLHSHAFQRAFAGLAEKRASASDDFWSWRTAMYRYAQEITPDDLLAVALQLYVEMVKAGYTRVCEFHYLHEPFEHVESLRQAAAMAGMGLTLAPVLYTSSAFGGRPPEPSQARFVLGPDEYLRRFERLRTTADGPRGEAVALGFHSLRAVTPEQMGEVLAAAPADAPVHIHVSEQTREVDDCLAWSGARPVEWLAGEIGLSPRWCLVHATHMAADEAAAAAASGAAAAVCPTTEGNLGDGFFDADGWFAAGGAWGIGSDSHVTVDPREELRWFDYGRRLNARRRGVSATDEQPHTGARLWLDAARFGAAPSGVPVGQLAPGFIADFLVLDEDHPQLTGRSGDALLDSLVFVSGSASPSPLKEVWRAGYRLVDEGRHPVEHHAADGFRDALARLAEKL